MSYQISYSSILYTKWPLNSMFTGSSKHRLVDGELLTKKRKSNETTKLKKVKKPKVEIIKPESIEESTSTESVVIVVKDRSYKLNKSKVRKKCNALGRLEKSKKFLAFYSISFPNGLTDEIGYKIYNTWLTRCRRDSGLKTYLWIAERQKNGTIHFHLLTNDFMPIKKVNGFMASCLASEKIKGVEVLREIDTDKYNGVDVKKVDKNRKSLIGYLTKYITKNEIEFTHLPWHCSRDVSSLFTAINFEQPDLDRYCDPLPNIEEKYNIHLSENFRIAGFKFRPNDNIYSDLDGVNEIIYKQQ
jgi:hypothetical protein